jgi:hypothetical protein
MERDVTKAYLEAACELSRFVCTDRTPVPNVFFVDMGENTQAYYQGGQVYLGNHLKPGVRAKAIFIHELVHHLQSIAREASDIGEWTDYEACMREAEAWGVFNEYIMDQERPDLYKYEWYSWYPHCRELT